MKRTSDYSYDLPEELIAQEPLKNRDDSRLLLVDRHTKTIKHSRFVKLPDYLQPGDILVANNSRVFPARIFGKKVGSGGQVEILLLQKVTDLCWRVIVGGKRIREGLQIRLDDRHGNPSEISAKVVAEEREAIRYLEFTTAIEGSLNKIGYTPLPPYIHKRLPDPERYQTIYSRISGSAAAPTAGLHFSPEVMISLREIGVLFETVTLHIGIDTFKPVTAKLVADHTIHSEWAELSANAARRINEAKLAGGRVIAVGTTAVRLLETAALRSAGISGDLTTISQKDKGGFSGDACPWRPVSAFVGNTDLFIYPGYRFRVVDAMITNFHLPRSSLLMMVSAFAGRDFILDTYQEAVKERYRFYSFGDAMLII